MKSRPKFFNLVLMVMILIGALGMSPQPVEALTSELFFSEYIEGSSFNKALEIYNGTDAAVDLSAYSISLYSNGSPTPTSTVTLSGTLKSGDVFVVANAGANAAILAVTDLTSSTINHNGDDAYALFKGTDMIDSFGKIGVDPGTGWGTEPITTIDHTLVRKASICAGDPIGDDDFDPATEWDAYAKDSSDNLGSHTCVCGPVIISDPVINEFSASTAGTDVEYVEIFGDPDTDYSAYTILEIEGDSNSAIGSIDEVISLGTTDASGFYNVNLPANALENGTISLLLVKGFAGGAGDDIDGNNDGIMDNTPWTSLVDSVAVNDGGAGDITYGAPVLFASYDGLSFAPGGASRIPDGYDTNSQSDWMRNDFDLAGIPGYTGSIVPGEAYNTPGATNVPEGSIPEMPPVVTWTLPMKSASSVPLDSNIEIVFSELVDVEPGWFEINCSISGIHNATLVDQNPVFILDPVSDFAAVETCTVNIYSANVKDTDLDDDVHNYMTTDYSFSFNTIQICGAPFTPIYDIQGVGPTTPLANTTVATEGVVVGDFQAGGKDGFFIQDPVGDGNPSTSDGIFIYAPSSMDVMVGDHVRVAGTANEYYDLTQISASQVWLCDTGVALPAPTVVSFPLADKNDLEKLESMYVTMPQDLVISEYFNYDRYGEIVLTSQKFIQFTAINEPDVVGFADTEAEFELSSITLDDGSSSQNPDPALHPNGLEFTLFNRFRGGDLVTNLTGVIDYSYSLWRVQPTQGADYTAANPRTAAPDIIEGDIKVASLNVYNYFTTLDTGAPICGPSGDMDCRGANDAEELLRQRTKIIAALADIEADVVGLMEIENDRPGPAPDYAVADLVDGLNVMLGAGTYDYIATGAIGTDAIKVAMIYKPGNVTPVGEFAILDSSVDARFLDDYNRPVLAQSFVDNLVGETITVAVNHLKSKGSDCNAVGDPDLGDGAGNCNLTRLSAAQAEVDWLATDPTGSGSDYVLIIGDLNSYDKEEPVFAIKHGADDAPGTGDDFTDLIYDFMGEEAYSYVFDGRFGYLDYAMANASLKPFVTDTTVWHINADEPDILDFDTEFKKPAQDALWEPNAFRASDHDPVIVTMTFNQAPLAEDDIYETDQDVNLVIDDITIGLLANDIELNENDVITLDVFEQPEHGTLLQNPDGSYLNNDGTFTYIPDPGFFGEDQFSYLLMAIPSGGRGAFSDSAKVSITVHPAEEYYFSIFFYD